jgi:hypothetical protein
MKKIQDGLKTDLENLLRLWRKLRDEANSGQSKIWSNNILHWRVSCKMEQIRENLKTDPELYFIDA